MKTAKVKLTGPEIDHLLTLLRNAEEEGSYYGHRETYWKRHDRITRALKEAACKVRNFVPKALKGEQS